MASFMTRSAPLASLLVKCLSICVLATAVGCADGGDLDDSINPSLGSDAAVYDAGLPARDASSLPLVDSGSAFPVVDAGSYPVAEAGAPSDAGRPSSDAGSATSDGGSKPSDAGSATSDGGGLMIPDIFGEGGIKIPDLFPTSDAGAPKPSTDGGRDVNGPCKDLGLICFDFIDMWINAECQTCNGGKGCQGCNIPFAY
jgi:hypothetical protein